MRRVIPGLEAPDAVLEAEIRARLDRVEEALEKAVVADSDLLATTARHLLTAGGKRFRPMLVLLAGYFGDPTDPRLIPGSVTIELTHLATLYHDDVIDEAVDRRGVPSTNARWDNTVAILTGDYLFARASELSADLGTEVCRLLARTIAVLCDGQIREVDAAGKVEQTEDAYLEIIRRKTGILIATSCRLGGLLSETPEDQLEVLEAFGESIGMAFQLSDDIMDVTASQLELGKEPGTDIREGVYTLPVLHALHEGPDRAELQRLLSARRSRRRDARSSPAHRPQRRLARARPRGRLGGGRPGRRIGTAVARWHSPARIDPIGAVPGGALRRGCGQPMSHRPQREGTHPVARKGRARRAARIRPRWGRCTQLVTYFGSYGVVFAVALAGALLVIVAFLAARLIAPSRPSTAKYLTYECGIDPVGEGWSQSQIRYYVYGFLFVIFDVESVFLFPWARVFVTLGYTAVVEMAIFIGILGAGLLYAWRKGVLKWA